MKIYVQLVVVLFCFLSVVDAEEVTTVEIYQIGGLTGTSYLENSFVNNMGAYNSIMKYQASINTFNGVFEKINKMISNQGKVFAESTLSQIVVVDKPKNQFNIAKFVQNINKGLDKNMSLNVQVYLGRCNQNNDALLDSSDSYLLFNPPLHTINHQPVIYQDISELSYVNKVTNTTIADKKITGLQQTTLQYGYSVSMLPNIMENNSSIIYLAISISDLKNMNEVNNADINIQLPTVSIIQKMLEISSDNMHTSCHTLGSLQTKNGMKQLVVLVTPNVYSFL